MPRFPAYRSPYDDTPLVDGDAAFRGFASRIQPTALGQGFLSRSENLRLEHALAQPRKGALAVCTDIKLNRPQITLDFEFEPGMPGVSIAYDAGRNIATVTLAAPLVQKPHHDRIAIEAGASGIEGVPEAYLGTFDILSLSNGGITITFAPNDEAGAPPAAWSGPFTINAGPVLSAIGDDGMRGSCVATDTRNREMVVMAFIDRAIIYRPGLPTAAIPYPPDHILAEEQDVALVQFVDKVFLFRGPDPTLVWDMDFAHPFAVVPQGDHPAASNDGNGNPSLIRQPPAPWGVVFNRQLILPRGRDEIIISDFGDPDTFDNLMSELRIMPGGNDWVLAVHPYQQARAIVFYRKSIHMVAFDTLSRAVDTVYEITRQLGCAARTSIANCGAQILWLSDAGVHALNIGQELNLTAAAAPLSEPIQDVIDRINWGSVERATSAYYGNRYYLAVPLDGSTLNNAVIIYNFLNLAWESVDIYPEGFGIRNFAVLDYSGQHRLHAATTYGYVYLLEERGDGLDEHGIYPDAMRSQVAGLLLTRGLTAGTIEPKRFTHLQIESEVEAGDTFTVANITRNPDTRRGLLNFTAQKGTDLTHRLHLRARGIAAQVEIRATAGRPRIKGLTMEAAAFNLQNTTRP